MHCYLVSIHIITMYIDLDNNLSSKHASLHCHALFVSMQHYITLCYVQACNITLPCVVCKHATLHCRVLCVSMQHHIVMCCV